MKNFYFVGAPTIEKGIEDFNEIAKSLPQAKFTWYCFRVSPDFVKKYPHINFVKGLDDAQLKKDVTTRMDCFICCSHFEGFCLPVAEAMRMEKPVISYDLDEIRFEFQETIEYVHTVSEFKKRLLSLTKKNYYTKDTKQGKIFIEKNYSPEVVSNRLLKIFQE